MAITDLADAFGAAIREIREELVTRSYFGRNPAGAGVAGVDAPQIDADDHSLAMDSGWVMPSEPEHDREDLGHDFDR